MPRDRFDTHGWQKTPPNKTKEWIERSSADEDDKTKPLASRWPTAFASSDPPLYLHFPVITIGRLKIFYRMKPCRYRYRLSRPWYRAVLYRLEGKLR